MPSLLWRQKDLAKVDSLFCALLAAVHDGIAAAAASATSATVAASAADRNAPMTVGNGRTALTAVRSFAVLTLLRVAERPAGE